ncbi:heme-degrading domain-containing protein [Curtobacterium sp. PhB115]|uniref:heme-degrading domain-containing protein n=1 Tax=Curtobacterium sp. PhB115 TaxID=2485173 RepID=UPI000F4B7CB1|nr:heme-binding protein [Curtobacterium sp. PhB115]ROP72612.1 uncharacterized protein (UPF0303 family) [Curtobacterium sp. PhB115]
MTGTADLDTTARLELLATQDVEVRFSDFTHDDAIALGQRIITLARERQQTISTSVWLGEQLVFQAALAGTSADNDGWMNRKVAVVRRFDKASLHIAEQMHAFGIEDIAHARMVDPMDYAFNGGAFPIRVGSAQVGVVVASGVDDFVEHDLVVEALRAHLER